MSFNICAISGKPIECPVISKKSGYIFEKRLIEKIIENIGKCPITNEILTKEDLIQFKN